RVGQSGARAGPGPPRDRPPGPPGGPARRGEAAALGVRRSGGAAAAIRRAFLGGEAAGWPRDPRPRRPAHRRGEGAGAALWPVARVGVLALPPSADPLPSRRGPGAARRRPP